MSATPPSAARPPATGIPGTVSDADPDPGSAPVEPETGQPDADLAAETPLPDDRFLNRELSWLDFNARVLALAEDPRTPLLERIKFLAIFASNLDEFYMVRLAGLKRRAQAGLPVRGPDRLPAREQLEVVAERSADLVAQHARCFRDEVQKLLGEENIHIVSWSELAPGEQEQLRSYFREHVFPVLTPLAVDPAHPFPYISGLSLNLAVTVRDSAESPERFARVKVPNNVPRFVVIDADRRSQQARPTTTPTRFLPVEELIAVHLNQLFPGMQVVEHHLFRVTRNADYELDEDRDEDLLQALERELAQRRFGPPVRLEVAASISDHVLELLVRELDMDSHDVLRIPGPLDLSALWEIYDQVERPELKDPPFVPATHARLIEGETPRSVFATLRGTDVLVHHPYHSFSTSVQRFIEQAAADPHVLAIKQTLYRTSGESPIVDTLIDAAEAGKQVVVLVEVKARFDELANIGWARALERAGCHVVYGLVGLKTHCKTALVVREEAGQIRRYCHIGTGNYHPRTARLYEDFGLLTADPEVGADLTDLFNTLTGYSRQTTYRRLLVAPHGIRSGLVERIDAQAAKARAGEPALIQFKANALVADQLVDALYRAAQAGVQVDLVIRGMCTLRPGVPGLSESIRVRSILGRFLEHSRIFRFGADPQTAEFWIGSADLMERNLDRRVEALVRVTDQAARDELAQVLDTAMNERSEGFDLGPDGVWTHRIPPDPQHLQGTLLARAVGTGAPATASAGGA
ncbi:RNA degradosome polyphosphate kinase [Natronosporangium hydrolyticum]|uniref:Polyphosphate kinase n=1 Tax=Natronosporangium hydrolyticum TaxID=2811111 RepID=A0A895YBD7_9ACTN|nr:RNA degradosome polyphosphate kinase [Natronosporangium hydrolyticum]QSB13595.1 RNA degradosome polyphosphate kinase [Natronosporangium hydrolyticum]